MKSYLARFFGRPFVRRVGAVASGAALSQAITMAFAPLITRLYGPEAFGLQGIFVSAVGIISVVAALGYPVAIVLPRSDAEALALVRLSVGVGTVMSLLAAIGLHFFGAGLLNWLNAQAIAAFTLLIPVAVYAAVLARVLAQWLYRKQAFAFSARFGVATTLTLNVAKAGIGLHWPGAGALITTNTLGGLAGTALTYWGWRRRRPEAAEVSAITGEHVGLADVARRHRDFPLLRTPQDLINALSQALPLLLLASYFGSGAAGHYAIAMAVLGVPAALIGSSVMAVLYPRIARAAQDGEDIRSLILRSTGGMALMAAVPFGLVMLVGPSLFGWVFGDGWATAGLYAQCLSPWLFMQFINQPAVAAIPVLGLQRGLLIYELFSTGTKVLALWLGFAVFGSDVAAVGLFSAFGVLAYAWLIHWVVRRSRSQPASDPAR